MWNFNYFKTALIVCLLCIIGRGSALAQKETQYVFQSKSGTTVTDNSKNTWKSSVDFGQNCQLPADPTQTNTSGRGLQLEKSATLTSDFSVSDVIKIVLDVSMNVIRG